MSSRDLRLPSFSSVHRFAFGAAIASLAGGGCLQILGLDSYKEGAGGSASSTGATMSSATMSGTMASGTMSSGTMSSGTMSTGATGTGGGAPAICTTQGSLTTVMSNPDFSKRDLAMAYDQANHNIIFAASYGGNMTSGVTVNIAQDNGMAGISQSWTAVGGGAQVLATAVKTGAIIVYVRSGNQIGEVSFPYDGHQVSSTPLPTFVPYTNINDADCSTTGHLNEVNMLTPLDMANPKWVAICEDQASTHEKVFVGTSTTSNFVSQEVPNEPADKLQSYFGLPGGQFAVFAGGDPTDGTWYRSGTTATDLATKRRIDVENDPNRVSLGIGEVVDSTGGVKVFIATIDKTTITPAKLYVAGAPGNSLTDLSMQPPPGLMDIADINMLSDLGGFSPMVQTTNRFAGAGSTVDQKAVLFTWLTSAGTILQHIPVRQATTGLSIQDAVTIFTNPPSYVVGWTEGDQTNQTIYSQTVICVGGP